jgi:hypothetical protein
VENDFSELYAIGMVAYLALVSIAIASLVVYVLSRVDEPQRDKETE